MFRNHIGSICGWVFCGSDAATTLLLVVAAG